MLVMSFFSAGLGLCLLGFISHGVSPLRLTQQQMWQLQPLQVGLESPRRSWSGISNGTSFCLLINQRQLTCCCRLDVQWIFLLRPSCYFYLVCDSSGFVLFPGLLRLHTHDVSSWGSHYYLITPRFSKQAAVSQMVITSSEDEPSVKIFLSGEVLFRGVVYPEGSFLESHLGVLQCLPPEWLQSFWFSFWSLTPKKAVGVVVGFYLLRTHTRGLFVQVSSTETSEELGDLIISFLPSQTQGTSSSFLLATTGVSSEVHITPTTGERDSLPLGGTIMCYSSFDLTQAISAARVLFSSFTLDIKTNGVLPH